MKFPWIKEEPAVAVLDTPLAIPPTDAAVQPKEPAPFPETYAAAKPTLDTPEITEYESLLAEIGIEETPGITLEKLRRCLQDESLPGYNKSQVVAYLDEKLGKEWEWAGLRQVDVDHLSGWVSHSEGQRDVTFSKRVYQGNVPLPVLLTVQKIQKAVPKVCFYVSSPKVVEGDPFLYVTSRGVAGYIVERWDEPNFRER